MKERSNQDALLQSTRNSEPTCATGVPCAYELIAEASTSAAWFYNFETGRAWHSASFLEAYRYEPATSPHAMAPWLGSIHPDDTQRVAASIQQALDRRSTSWTCKYRLMRRDETYAFVFDRGRIEYGTSGRPLHVAGNIVDLSDEERALSESSHSEQKYRQLIDQASDAIFTTDTTGRFLDANPSTIRLLGFSIDELRSLTIFDIIPENSRSVPILLGSLKVGETAVVERVYRRKDGSLLDVENSVSFSPWETYQVIARDITQKNCAETELRASRQMIQQVQKLEALGQLAGGVAHDFNNILMVVRSYGELIRERVSPESKCFAYVDAIVRAADRGAALTQQMLAFSRKQILSPRIINLNQVLRETLKMVERLIGEHIELEFAPQPDLPCVNADPGQIDQIILNLAVNARDAMPNGGRLKIETRKVTAGDLHPMPENASVAADYSVITVSDTGTGMTEEVQARIFEPFFTTKEPGRGTGLGLAMVYGVVKQSGGHLHVRSEIGQGSSFEIYLPCATVAPGALVQQTGSATERQCTGWTILVVEDTADLRRSLCEFLEAYGFTVLEADSPLQALQIAESAPRIDVLLTDVVMPKMRGDELSGKLTEARPNLKTLYMTGYTDLTMVDESVFANEERFLQKPFSLRDMVKKIQALMPDEMLAL